MPSFQIEQFARSDAAGETVAIRIDGRWIAEQPEVVSDPVLLIRNGPELARIEPAPGSGTNVIATPAGEYWGADFMVPAAAVAGDHAGYALEIAGGMAFALPEPAGAPVAPAATPPSAPAPAAYAPPEPPAHTPPAPPASTFVAPPAQGAPESAGENHELLALQEAVRELQGRLESERHGRRAAEDQLEQEKIGRQRDVATAAAAVPPAPSADPAAIDAARAHIEELEARLKASDELQAQLQQRVGEAEAETQTLQGALQTTREAHAQARAQALAHEATIAELHSGAAEVQATQADAGAQLAAATARADEAERQLRDATAEISSLHRQAQDASERAVLQSEARDTAQRHAGALQAEVQALAVRLQDAERVAIEADRELQEASAKLEETDERLNPSVAAFAPIEPTFAPPAAQAPPLSSGPPIAGVPPAPKPPVEEVPVTEKRKSFRLPKKNKEPGSDQAPVTEKRKSFRLPKKNKEPGADQAPVTEKRKSFRLERKAKPDASATPEIVAASAPTVPGSAPSGPPPGAQVAAITPEKAAVADAQAKPDRRTINLMLIVVAAAGALLAAEANGLIQAWPLNP